MTDKSPMPVRQLNPVEPLGQPTAMRTTDTADPQQIGLWSGAVTGQIGASLPAGDVDSSPIRRTRATAPSFRTSLTATATGTTRTTSVGLGLFADSTAPLDGAPFPMSALAQAWGDCRRHKRQTASAQAFEENIERNLCQLRTELLDQSYKPARSICFVVTHPRPREVWAASFRDRVVHHLLYNAIAPRFITSFDAGSAACIEGRGTLYAAQRLEHDIRSITENWQHQAFYLKIDLANFFVAIDKKVLQAQLHRKVNEPFWRWLTDTVLMHDPRTDFELRGDSRLLDLVPPHKRLVNAPPDTGLPIGNLSSQFFANVHLNDFDQFCKHQLKTRHYGRYVDDAILLHRDPQHLSQALQKISVWLPKNLGCRLNASKTIIQPVSRGVDFVGQVIKPWRRTTRKRTLAAAITRLKEMPEGEVFAVGNSYLGLSRQASHSHHEQAELMNVLRRRGFSFKPDLSKIFAKNGASS